MNEEAAWLGAIGITTTKAAAPMVAATDFQRIRSLLVRASSAHLGSGWFDPARSRP
jgi:hypothetical protein